MSKSPATILVEALQRQKQREADHQVRLDQLRAKEAELSLHLELKAVDLPKMAGNGASDADIPDTPKVPGGWRKPKP